MHILVVEDSPINRRFIGLALSKAKIQVTNAENGRIGVDKATKEEFDAILMDMQMPVMDGFEATAHLRQLGLTTPIIALTGHSTDEDRKRCLRVGCNDHLTKPVDATELLGVLDQVAATSAAIHDSHDFSDELRQIARDYLDVQRQRITEMRELLQVGEFDSLAELAHRVKGTAGTVGFPQFTIPAERLEKLAVSAEPQACAEILEQMLDLQAEAEAHT